ncbi:MAG: hypothetical protein JXA19_00675 [Anaerolineales bacterium]|nr:hypothetical protein [Anaerolineales bacterium]
MIKNSISKAIAEGSAISRNGILKLLNAGLQTSEYKFVRKLASQWLGSYPGDIEVELLYVQALIPDGMKSDAISILRRLCDTDPENLTANKLLLQVSGTVEYSILNETKTSILILEGKDTEDKDLAAWGASLSYARTAIQKGETEQADTYIQHALMGNPSTPLVAITHLELAKKCYEWKAFANLVESYFKRWPNSLVCKLYQADVWMQSGKEEKAVALLHECALSDTLGIVPKRIWGINHSYQTLWPDTLVMSVEEAIPAAVSGALGWNQLNIGIVSETSPNEDQKSSPREFRKNKQTVPFSRQTQRKTDYQLSRKAESKPGQQKSTETLIDVQDSINRIAADLNRSDIATADARYPVFVVLSTRNGLINKYGEAQYHTIRTVMEKVVRTTRGWQNWDSVLLLADDPDSTKEFNLSPAKSDDPWEIKQLIMDLEKQFRAAGEMIGAVLIVGNNDVVPFHRLPNPVEDLDDVVYSDNPYASEDENYFVPEWSLGRLPGAKGNDPTLLLTMLNKIVENREKTRNQKSNGFMTWFSPILRMIGFYKKQYPSFGYTAEIWRRASHSVFRQIGDARDLAISPPCESETLMRTGMRSVNLGYFNLHGLEDSPEWYGQRDPLETENGPDYPVAMRPGDILNSGKSPQIVFSEACYGGHVENKTPDTAISLKFLNSGTQVMIGSSSTSYGSIGMPLIAADLLGQVFWKFLQDGFLAGESLRRAKIYLAKEMHNRQGYLDGEDQKTLISFNLFGDPLSQPEVNNSKSAKHIFRELDEANDIPTTIRKSPDEPNLTTQIPREVVRSIKLVVKAYLPGMSDARVHYSPDQQLHSFDASERSKRVHSNNQVVTLSKTVNMAGYNHKHFAHITLDKDNKLVKIAVSK